MTTFESNTNLVGLQIPNEGKKHLLCGWEAST